MGCLIFHHRVRLGLTGQVDFHGNCMADKKERAWEKPPLPESFSALFSLFAFFKVVEQVFTLIERCAA